MSGSPASGKSCFDRPSREDCPAARTIPAITAPRRPRVLADTNLGSRPRPRGPVPNRGVPFAADAPGRVGQRPSGATAAEGDDLAEDADSHLLGGGGADIQPDRRAHAGDLLRAHPGLGKTATAILIGAAAADGADIGRGRRQGADEGRFVELRVVGKNGDVGVGQDSRPAPKSRPASPG